MMGCRLLFVLSALALQGVAACGDGGTGVDTRVPARVEVLDGDEQEVLMGNPLPQPLRVRVTDRSGNPVEGARVRWGSNGGTFSAAETVTDASGIASVTWAMSHPLGLFPVGARQATAAVDQLSSAIFTGYSRRGLELQSVSFTPSQVNVASGSATVTVTVRAITDFGDVTAGGFQFVGPGGSGIPFTQVFLTSGTAKDGVWQGTAQVPQGAPAGAWQPQVRMRSTAQELTWYHVATATNGLQNLLTVAAQ